MSVITSDQRFLLDPIVELLRRVYQGVETREVHASMLHPFDDPLVAKRNYPMRIVDVVLGGDLQDHIIFAGCFREDVIADIMQASMSAIVEFTGVAPESVVTLVTHELENAEQAVDMLDGFWACPTVTFDHRDGDLMVIFGTGFARACETIIEVNAGQYPGQIAHEDVEDSHSESPELPSTQTADDDVEDVDPEPQEAGREVIAPFTEFADLSSSAVVADEQVLSSSFSSAMPTVEVVLSAELGSTQMPLGSAAGLGANTVLTLEQRMDEPVQVLVNGVPYATARMVVVDGEYGLEILEVHDRYGAAENIAA